jgi:hypothetical protein
MSEMCGKELLQKRGTGQQRRYTHTHTLSSLMSRKGYLRKQGTGHHTHTHTHLRIHNQKKGVSENEAPGPVGAYTTTHPHTHTHFRVPSQEKGASENEVPGFVGAFTQTHINTRLVAHTQSNDTGRVYVGGFASSSTSRGPVSLLCVCATSRVFMWVCVNAPTKPGTSFSEAPFS